MLVIIHITNNKADSTQSSKVSFIHITNKFGWPNSHLASVQHSKLLFYFFYPANNTTFKHDLDAMGVVRGIGEQSFNDTFCKLTALLILFLYDHYNRTDFDRTSFRSIHHFDPFLSLTIRLTDFSESALNWFLLKPAPLCDLKFLHRSKYRGC